MRGLGMAGPRPFQGVAAQIKNADIENVSRLEGIARAESTTVDTSKSRPSRDVDRSGGSTDSGRSHDRDRGARFDPNETFAHGGARCGSCPRTDIRGSGMIKVR